MVKLEIIVGNSSIKHTNLPSDSKSRFRDICADLSSKLHDFFEAHDDAKRRKVPNIKPHCKEMEN
jgi:hypothetical protein